MPVSQHRQRQATRSKPASGEARRTWAGAMPRGPASLVVGHTVLGLFDTVAGPW
jgi:hypothetical protein